VELPVRSVRTGLSGPAARPRSRRAPGAGSVARRSDTGRGRPDRRAGRADGAAGIAVRAVPQRPVAGPGASGPRSPRAVRADWGGLLPLGRGAAAPPPRLG